MINEQLSDDCAFSIYFVTNESYIQTYVVSNFINYVSINLFRSNSLSISMNQESSELIIHWHKIIRF